MNCKRTYLRGLHLSLSLPLFTAAQLPRTPSQTPKNRRKPQRSVYGDPIEFLDHNAQFTMIDQSVQAKYPKISLKPKIGEMIAAGSPPDLVTISNPNVNKASLGENSWGE